MHKNQSEWVHAFLQKKDHHVYQRYYAQQDRFCQQSTYNK